ncbi:MAG: transposase [Synechococcus sp. SB0668_bin_13]|nr:transposase [Synechococcus sp. SB0668_bin_13]
MEVAEKFAKEEEARAWIEELGWPDGPCCPHCGSTNAQ